MNQAFRQPAASAASEIQYRPKSTAEVAHAVQTAIQAGQQLSFGELPKINRTDRKSASITLRDMNQVVDYPARDMTITVQAGLTIGELCDMLSSEQQQLPIDWSDPQQTVGSLVACDGFGPRRYGHGTLRDYVIGLEAVDGHGRIFQAGGRVVKNVAGYDLCRLMTGSSGQLAILTQVTLKLKPAADRQRLAIFGFTRLAELESSLERLNLSAACPVLLEMLNRSAASAILPEVALKGQIPPQAADCNFFLVCGVEGTASVCDWQMETLQDELQHRAAWKWIETATADRSNLSDDFCRRIMQLQQPDHSVEWLVRLTTLPSRVVSSVSMLERHACLIFGRAANGVLFFRRELIGSQQAPIEHTDPGLPEVTAVSTLKRVVEDDVGSVNVLKSSEASGANLTANCRRLTTSLCQLFDPHQVFSSHSG